MLDVMNPVHCIVPPHMLRNLYSNGSVAQRNVALASIVGSARLRGQREANVIEAAMTTKAASTGKRRRVFSAENGSGLPGKLVLEEGGPQSVDDAVNEAYTGAGATYDLFWEVYGRDSLDDRGMSLDSTVHYQRKYDNAFWDGSQMVYGDGDGQLFNRFTIAVDVIGHELTHGVTQFTSALLYRDQPGALNESLSDVFGSLVKQRERGQAASQADWLVGEGLFTAKVKGVALRSMKEPGAAYDDPVLGKDPQPAHMRDYVRTTDDNGGVHINSGIPNHAFFLAAVAMGGAAWEKAGKIWYVSAKDRFGPTTDFQTAANLTNEVTGQLFGAGGLEQQAVRYGWEGVGITIGAAAPPAPTPAPRGCATAVLGLLHSFIHRTRGHR